MDITSVASCKVNGPHGKSVLDRWSVTKFADSHAFAVPWEIVSKFAEIFKWKLWTHDAGKPIGWPLTTNRRHELTKNCWIHFHFDISTATFSDQLKHSTNKTCFSSESEEEENKHVPDSRSINTDKIGFNSFDLIVQPKYTSSVIKVVLFATVAAYYLDGR